MAGLSLRRLAERAGITTPTVYAYFPSKNDIYDAMFLQAAVEFEAHMLAPYRAQTPPRVIAEGLNRFLAFCTSDPVRYQLLFQRTLTDFEPSPDAYAPAVRALDGSRARRQAAGITDPRHVDLWTALTTGLASQQIANDPGGKRWIDLADDASGMFLAYCLPETKATRRSRGN